MAYIGKQPVVGNFVKLDAITTSATATYNLLNGGVAYFPQTANNCIVSLNGVIQSPTSAYTISGSTIVFSDALTASDSIDFILVLGDVLSIGTPSDGTITSAKIVDGTIGLAKLSATGTKDATTFLRGDNTFASAGAAAGQVIQVVSATKTDTASSSSSTFADITGLSVNITPSSASNKILVIAYINAAWDNALAKIGTRIMRDSTAIAIGDTAGSRIRTSGYLYAGVTNDSPFVISVNFLDSPNTTSSTTYKWQFANLDSAGTVYVNRSGVDTNSVIQSRTASAITVMEIKG